MVTVRVGIFELGLKISFRVGWVRVGVRSRVMVVPIEKNLSQRFRWTAYKLNLVLVLGSVIRRPIDHGSVFESVIHVTSR